MTITKKKRSEIERNAAILDIVEYFFVSWKMLEFLGEQKSWVDGKFLAPLALAPQARF